jgi:hypothetical protein
MMVTAGVNERRYRGGSEAAIAETRKLACFLISLPRRTATYYTQEGAVEKVSLILRLDDRTLR